MTSASPYRAAPNMLIVTMTTRHTTTVGFHQNGVGTTGPGRKHTPHGIADGDIPILHEHAYGAQFAWLRFALAPVNVTEVATRTKIRIQLYL